VYFCFNFTACYFISYSADATTTVVVEECVLYIDDSLLKKKRGKRIVSWKDFRRIALPPPPSPSLSDARTRLHTDY
jgi:hypothetical protein